ncbi:unnamed protein product [Boreogadus saida]
MALADDTKESRRTKVRINLTPDSQAGVEVGRHCDWSPDSEQRGERGKLLSSPLYTPSATAFARPGRRGLAPRPACVEVWRGLGVAARPAVVVVVVVVLVLVVVVVPAGLGQATKAGTSLPLAPGLAACTGDWLPAIVGFLKQSILPLNQADCGGTRAMCCKGFSGADLIWCTVPHS